MTTLAIPPYSKTWTISIGNRYVYGTGASVLLRMANFILSLKNFLKNTMGYTVKGSCNGSTGAMDGVDRWSAATDANTRFNGSAGAQSWIVLTDGAGVNWCFSFNSAQDYIYRIAHSTGGNYVAAGTPTQQPTATDECFDAAAGSMTSTQTSGDDVWHLWGSSDKKIWRAVINRQKSFKTYLSGESDFVSSLVAPATFTLVTGGGTVGAVKFYTIGQDPPSGSGSTTGFSQPFSRYSASNRGFCARVKPSASDVNTTGNMGFEFSGGGVGSTNGSPGTTTQYAGGKAALQGDNGRVVFPIMIGCANSNADGKMGWLYDQWATLPVNSSDPGDLTPPGKFWGNRAWVHCNHGLILPWDGSSGYVTT